MQIALKGESDILLRSFEEPDFEIEIDADDEHVHFSALPMFAASLGLCTASVLGEYARQLEISVEELEVRVRWSYDEDPFRVDSIDMEISWPELPESRRKAAERAAAQCTIHNTLEHPPEIQTALVETRS
jgi:uncharacterized OsmC-like protein